MKENLSGKILVGKSAVGRIIGGRFITTKISLDKAPEESKVIVGRAIVTKTIIGRVVIEKEIVGNAYRIAIANITNQTSNFQRIREVVKNFHI